MYACMREHVIASSLRPSTPNGIGVRAATVRAQGIDLRWDRDHGPRNRARGLPHEEKYQKQLEFLENYLDTIRREVDEKTRELDELKLQALHVQNANAFEEFELATKNRSRNGRKRVEIVSNIIGSSSRSRS